MPQLDEHRAAIGTALAEQANALAREALESLARLGSTFAGQAEVAGL